MLKRTVAAIAAVTFAAAAGAQAPATKSTAAAKTTATHTTTTKTTVTKPAAVTTNGKMATTTTKTGKKITYDCSKKGNMNKAACKK